MLHLAVLPYYFTYQSFLFVNVIPILPVFFPPSFIVLLVAAH